MNVVTRYAHAGNMNVVTETWSTIPCSTAGDALKPFAIPVMDPENYVLDVSYLKTKVCYMCHICVLYKVIYVCAI